MPPDRFMDEDGARELDAERREEGAGVGAGVLATDPERDWAGGRSPKGEGEGETVMEELEKLRRREG